MGRQVTPVSGQSHRHCLLSNELNDRSRNHCPSTLVVSAAWLLRPRKASEGPHTFVLA